MNTITWTQITITVLRISILKFVYILPPKINYILNKKMVLCSSTKSKPKPSNPMTTTTICHTNPYPLTPNPNDLQHHHYQIHHHQTLQSNFNHNSNILWTIKQPKPPTPSRIKERGIEWVSPRKEEIEGEIKETILTVAGGGEWRGRKPRPLPPIWVSQHTQGGEAVLPIKHRSLHDQNPKER